jgi:hypothetical protein
MVTNDNPGINLEELASGLVDDMTRISDSAAKIKEPQTMDDIDVSIFKVDSLKALVASLSVGLKTRADETAGENQAQVDKVTDIVSQDLADRQVKYQTDLAAFKESVASTTGNLTPAEKAEADVILTNVSKQSISINQSVAELKIQKEVFSGQVTRLGVIR